MKKRAPTKPINRSLITEQIETSLYESYRECPITACWNWVGTVSTQNYGVMRLADGKMYRSHRVAYYLRNGSIQDDMVIDHKCKNTRCVNPDHLEQVTLKENTWRGLAPSSLAGRRESCSKGHKYTEQNTSYDRDGARVCRTCQRAIQNKYRSNRRIALEAERQELLFHVR